MKVYFTGQLYRKKDYIGQYRAIIKSLKDLDHEVLEYVMEYSADDVLAETSEQTQAWYKTWYRCLDEMDVCVAEISFPSTINIGFEVATILEKGKPVVAIFQKDSDPVFMSPEFSRRMIKVEYTLDNVKEVLGWALEEAEQWLHRRFTFFISSEIDSFLDKVSQDDGISRSEFIRGLIESEMKRRKG